MIDAGYVSISGEAGNEHVGVSSVRLVGLIIGLLFVVLPINILVNDLLNERSKWK